MATEILGFWGRALIVAAGSSVVVLTVIVVLCLVRPGCWLNAVLLQRTDSEKKRIKALEKERLCGVEPPLVSYRASENNSVATEPPDQVSDDPVPIKPGFFESSLRRLTPPFMYYKSVGDTTSVLGSLSTKRDSTYSSMSENSGRTSPTNSYRSSVDGSIGSAGGSNIGSPTNGDAQGQISFAVQFVLTNEERGTGKLIITVMTARGLQGRQYMGGACDPYVKVLIWKERRSLRKLKSSPLHTYRTRTVRHTSEPLFNESFVTEVNKCDVRDLMVKIVAMDSDKWVSPTTLGEVIQPLKDIKVVTSNPEKTTLNYFLAPAKLDFGEVLFGLSYLPTAQRLSVSVMKATHLKYTNVVEDITNFCPYVRILLISASGRVLRKKKTTFRSQTEKPVWNETLIFDMPANLVDSVTFILAVCSRPPTSPGNDETIEDAVNAEIEESLSLHPPVPKAKSNSASSSPCHDSYKRHDKYVGKVVLGCNVVAGEEKNHWMSVLTTPRKVCSQWHCLK